MSILQIIKVPNPMLFTPSKLVEKNDEKLKIFFNDMLETMYDAKGVGIAAVQVAKPIRAAIINLPNGVTRDGPYNNPTFLVNPEMIWKSEETWEEEEGCLSVPGARHIFKRPLAVKLKYFDLEGSEHVIEADGWKARCIQHELDHLDGKLIVHHASMLKRDMLIKKSIKFQKQDK